jgi:transcriptional regulator with XRE-family HTH domain
LRLSPCLFALLIGALHRLFFHSVFSDFLGDGFVKLQTRSLFRGESTDSILAKNLVAARAAAGLTQHELAEAAGVSRATIAHLETGVSDPRLSTLVDLATAMGVPALLLLVGAREAQALVDLPEGIEEERPFVSDSIVEKMRRRVASGMLRDRLLAARLGASVVPEGDSLSARVSAAIFSAILPGPGTLTGAAFGRSFTTESEGALAHA